MGVRHDRGVTNQHHPILFVSGAGLSPWVWDGVRHHLTSASTVAPRPSGHSDAALLAYAEAAVAAAPTGPFAIVAHSSGGVVGTRVARLVPERVSGFLAIAAVIPPPGGSFISAMPAPNRWLLSAAIRLAGTRPPAKAIRLGLCGGLTQDVADRIVADFTPESARLYLDKADNRPWTGRRGYLLTAQDRELPLNLQRRFAHRLGADWVDQIATGHLPMLQDPAGTAAAVHAFLASCRLPTDGRPADER